MLDTGEVAQGTDQQQQQQQQQHQLWHAPLSTPALVHKALSKWVLSSSIEQRTEHGTESLPVICAKAWARQLPVQLLYVRMS